MFAPLVLAAALAGSSASLPRLVVLELSPGAGVDPSLSGPITEALTSEAQRRGFFEVVSTRDVQALLGLERQRQLLGCGDSASGSCMAELSGALGARFVLSGTLAKLGDAWQLTLSTLDSQRAQPIGRATRLARSVDALRATLPWAVAEATGTPAPPAPSRLASNLVLGAGAAAAIFGVVWGGVALGQQQQLEARLQAGATTTGVLGTKASVDVEAQRIRTQEQVAAGALVAGLALVAVGAWLAPADPAGGAVAVVPSSQGLFVVGVFP